MHAPAMLLRKLLLVNSAFSSAKSKLAKKSKTAALYQKLASSVCSRPAAFDKEEYEINRSLWSNFGN